MKLLRYIFYPFKLLYKLFKLLYKIPYYKLFSYIFLIVLLYYSLSEIINYLFWYFNIIFTFDGYQIELWQYWKDFDEIYSGNFLSIFTNTVKGNLIGLSFYWMAYNTMFFNGMELIPGIIDILLIFGILYMIYRVLRDMPISKYTFWVLFSWAVLMIFVSNNLEFIGIEHSMPLHAYFLGILDLSLLLQFDKWKSYKRLRRYFLHGLFIVCLILTSFVWTVGLLIPIIIVFLLLLQREYKYFFFYLCLVLIVVGYVVYADIVVEHAIVKIKGDESYGSFMNFIRFAFTMFGSPVSNGYDLRQHNIVWAYIRGTIVIGLIIWTLYISKLLQLVNIKKFFAGGIQFKKWEIFFLGFFIWTLSIVVITIALRYRHVAEIGGLYGVSSFFKRYYLHMYMFFIPLFVFIIMYTKHIKLRKIRGILALLVIYYVPFVLIHYNTRTPQSYYLNDQHNILAIAMGSQNLRTIYDGNMVFAKFFSLSGYHVWQRELMGINLNQFLSNKTNAKKFTGNEKDKLWFVKDKPCNKCTVFFETKKYKKGKFGIKNKYVDTIQFQGKFKFFPYHFSRTVFITDESGVVVGLGFSQFSRARFVDLFKVFQYWRTTQNFDGFLYSRKSSGKHRYTMWALAFDRRHISKLITFTFNPFPNHQVYLDIKQD